MYLLNGSAPMHRVQSGSPRIQWQWNSILFRSPSWETLKKRIANWHLYVQSLEMSRDLNMLRWKLYLWISLSPQFAWWKLTAPHKLQTPMILQLKLSMEVRCAEIHNITVSPVWRPGKVPTPNTFACRMFLCWPHVPIVLIGGMQLSIAERKRYHSQLLL